MSWALLRNTLGHFHPAIVHFPVALALTGAGFEAWRALRHEEPSRTGRLLLLLAALAGALAALSGLALFRADDFQARTLAAASVHRVLGLTTAAVLVIAASLGGVPGRTRLEGFRLVAYRVIYGVAALLVGLTGHYGGWVVFGWGRIWAP